MTDMPTHGGARPGAGAKRKPTSDVTRQYLAARAAKEAALARLREAEAGEQERKLIPATEVEEVVSQAYARIAQTLFGLPDTLERMVGLTPDQAEKAEQVIHAAMGALADDLQTMATDLQP